MQNLRFVTSAVPEIFVVYQNLKSRSRDLGHAPFWPFSFLGILFLTVNSSAEFEVCIFSRSRDIKGFQNWKSTSCYQGYAPFWPVKYPLLQSVCKNLRFVSSAVLEILRDPKIRKVGHLTHQPFFFSEKKDKWSFIWYKTLDKSFFRFVTIHAFDWQTDRQTDGQTDSFLVPIPTVVKILKNPDHRQCSSATLL